VEGFDFFWFTLLVTDYIMLHVLHVNFCILYVCWRYVRKEIRIRSSYGRI